MPMYASRFGIYDIVNGDYVYYIESFVVFVYHMSNTNKIHIKIDMV
jgi:predicted RNA-binding protein with TRAM domain